MRRMLPLAFMLLAWVNPPPACNAVTVAVEVRCLENPQIVCTVIYNEEDGMFEWPDPVVDTAWWWMLRPLDANGQTILDPGCQPTNTTMDGWLVP
jgi:hypothetical protein